MVSRRALLLVVLALMVAPQGARAAGTPAPSPRAASAAHPHVARSVRSGRVDTAAQPVLDPATIVKGAFGSVAAFKDPKNYVRATREIFEQLSGQKAYDTTDPPVGAPPRRASSSQDSAEGTSRTPIPIGDLSGDGLPDVVVLDEFFRPEDPSYITHADLTALDGSGAKLWIFAIQRNSMIVPTVDVNDDGRADLLLVEYFEESTEDGQFQCGTDDRTCAGSYGHAFHWRFSLLSGRTGAPLNPVTFAGKVQTIQAFHYDAPRPTAQVYIVQTTNALVLPFVSDDHDGDGRRELVLNAIDMTTSFSDEQTDASPTASLYSQQIALLTSTDATVRSGADPRTILFEKKQALHMGEPALHLGEPALLLPAGNMIGDSTGDLLWEGGANPEQGTIDLQGQQDIGDLLPLIPSLTPLTFACLVLSFDGRCVGAQFATLNAQAFDGSRVTPFAPNWRNTYFHDPHDGKSPTDVLFDGTEFFSQPFLVPLLAEVSGDTNQDLEIIYTPSDYWDVLKSHGQTVENAHGYPSRTGVVSGLNGDELWTTGYSRMIYIGHIAEGGPGDFVALSASSDAGILTVAVERLDGLTGTNVGESFVGFPLAGDNTWGDIGFDLAGDVNADGVSDPLLSMVSTDESGNSKSSIAVVSGKSTGEPIYQEIGRTGIRRPDVAGDVTGDGRADLYVEERIGTAAGFKVETTAVGLPSGTTVWKKTLMDTTPNYDFRLQRAGDLFGLGHEAMVVQRVQFNPNETSEVAGIDGLSGTQHWSFGDATQAPGGHGFFSGVVTDAGSQQPLDGICVAAYDGSGHRVASETTSGGGAYTLGPLLAGNYRAFFSECAQGNHVGHWYGGPSFSEASTIAVVDYSTTTGIDIALEAVSPPPNDLIENAKDMKADDSWTQSVDTTGAQTESGEPLPCDIGATAWYTFTAPSTEMLTVSASPDGFQSALAVYAGTVFPQTQAGCSADDSTGTNPGGSQVQFTAVQGVTYYIQAGGKSSAGGPMTVTLAQG